MLFVSMGVGTAFAALVGRHVPQDRPALQGRSGGIVPLTAAVGDNIANASLLQRAGRIVSASGSLEDTNTYDGTDDVYAVFLLAGETVDFTFDASAGTDFGLYVYGPNATDIWVDDPISGIDPAHDGGPATRPATFSMDVFRTGYYFVNPFSGVDGGNGTYSLSMNVSRAYTDVVLNPLPSLLAYDAQPVISGTVTGPEGETVVGWVRLLFSLDGRSFAPLDEQRTDTGAFSFTGLYSRGKRIYLVQYEGSDIFVGNTAAASVNAYAKVSAPTARRLGTRRYFLSGTVQSRHAPGTSVARIYLQRLVRGRWVSASSALAKASDKDSLTSTYAGTVRFPVAGKYRARTLHSDGDHAATNSGYTTFTVK
ncbi:MAG: hypothetical protein Q7W30_08335 [Coriobacteriia bacterium]|nr:hypothetical protein [Coriobacteriia bacterium]